PLSSGSRGLILGLITCLILTLTFHIIHEEAAAAGEKEPGSPETLTLEEALSIALRDNLSVDNAVLEVKKAGDAVKAAKTKLYPEFNVGAYESYHLTNEAFSFKKGAFGNFPVIGPIPAENTKITTTPDFTTFLNATVAQPITQLYEITLYIRQRQIEQSLFGQDLRSKQQEVAENVKKEYYNILKSESSLAAEKEKILFLRELLELVNRYVSVGRALESESLDVKARLGKAEYEEFKLKNEMATEKEKLNKLLGRDIDTEFTVTPVSRAEPLTINPKEAGDIALEQRPEVNAAKLNIKYAENEVDLKKSQYIPEVGVELQYTANLDIELLPENTSTVALFAKWEFFDWGRRQAEIAEKKKAVLQAENLLDESRSQVLIDVNSKIRNLEEAAALIDVAELEQAAAKERLRVTMNKYRVDSAILQEVLEAESSLEEKNKDYQEAVLEYWNSRAELEKAMGED
ncbi:MAG TPA: TolC family protein, partial [Thermodesulfobacteriota bacterium]|nr:TolC family protein [Thermodesulfobacteriota bacterium]